MYCIIRDSTSRILAEVVRTHVRHGLQSRNARFDWEHVTNTMTRTYEVLPRSDLFENDSGMNILTTYCHPGSIRDQWHTSGLKSNLRDLRSFNDV